MEMEIEAHLPPPPPEVEALPPPPPAAGGLPPPPPDVEAPPPPPPAEGGRPAQDGWAIRLEENDRQLEAVVPILMGVAAIVAGVALQAGLNPPGGVLSEKFNDGNQEIPPGKSILAVEDVKGYEHFYTWQSITLMSAIVIIGTAVSGLPVNRRSFVLVLRLITWTSLLSMLLLNASSIAAFTPVDVYGREKVTETLRNSIFTLCGLMVLVLLAHIVRLIIEVLQRGGRERGGRGVGN